MKRVEIVCCSLEDCLIAETNGAGRIELCACLEVGGLTPSIGLATEVSERCSLPVMTMIRPRGGGFGYEPSDIDAMVRDIECLPGAGFVFGCLTPEGDVDMVSMRRLVTAANGRQTVCHRAFDVVRDPRVAVEQLIDLRMTRILTSGRCETALEGCSTIAEVRAWAGGRIEVLPACGIRSDNAAEVRRLTGCDWVHLAPWEMVAETSCQQNPSLSFSGLDSPADGQRARTDGAEVERVCHA